MMQHFLGGGTLSFRQTINLHVHSQESFSSHCNFLRFTELKISSKVMRELESDDSE